jgi:hypothetical protein
MPSDHCPSLSDPAGALEIMALGPERRAEALGEASDAYSAQVEVNGGSPVDAALFGLKMRRLIEAAMRAIEAGGEEARRRT